MIVISDTSPITNLLQVNHLHLLEQLFEEVVITPQVYMELCELEFQKSTIDQLNWISIVKPHDQEFIIQLEAHLDEGEASSIVLALELQADYLLIDEYKGRAEAEKLGLKITGIIGVLLLAKQQHYIQQIKPVLDQLKEEVGFRIHPTLYDKVLAVANEK